MSALESAILEINRRLARIENAIFVQNGVGQCRHIMAVVAREYGYTIANILSKRKYRKLGECSVVAMFLCRELTELSLHEIGDQFKRDHTCVSYAARTVPDWLSLNCESKLSARVARLRAKLQTQTTTNGEKNNARHD